MKFSLSVFGLLLAGRSETNGFVHPVKGRSSPVSIEVSERKVAEIRTNAAKTATNEAPPLRRHAPRKICLMVEPTPFTHVSGYSNRFSEMLRYLSKAGDEVNIITTDTNTPAKDLPEESYGFPIHHTQGFTFPLYNQISLTFDVPELKGIKVMEKSRPDLIHATSPGFLLLASILYARILRVPLVMSYHTHLPSYGKNYMGYIPGIEEFAWWLIRTAHARADLTLVTSSQMQKQLLDNGVSRVEVWRKGIDTVRFNPKFKDEEMRGRMSEGHTDDFLMVYVGRLGSEKRLKDIKAVLERMPNARLCIVGKGPQEEELHKFFKGTKTVFTGLLQGDDLSKAFASADVFVMPSDSETLGFVVLEAMASGVPVVAVNAGGIPDIIDDGETSYLVPTGDTDAFVKTLTMLREDVALRDQMSLNARKEAERWSWESATSVLRNIQYERALINFHSRALGGFGRPDTKSVWRRLKWRVRGLMGRLRVPGFRNALE